MRTVERLIFMTLVAAIALSASPAWRWVIMGVPIYWSEAAALAFVGLTFSVFGWQESFRRIRQAAFANRPLVIGLGIMALGLVSSLIVSSATDQARGIVKAWFLIPCLLGCGVFVSAAAGKTRLILGAGLTGLSVSAAVAAIFLLRGDLTFDGRLQGLFPSPNLLAMHISAGMFLAGHFYRVAGTTWVRRLSLVSLPLFAVVLWHTASYTTWLSLIVGAAVWWLVAGQVSIRRGGTALMAVLLIGAALLATQRDQPKFVHWFDGSERSSLDSRMMIWRSSAKMISDHPLAGIGMGNFQATYLEYQKYYPPYLEWAVPTPHNLYLMFWLSTGFSGLVGFLMLIAAWWRGVWQTKENSPRLAGLYLAWMAMMLAQGVFDTPYWRTDLAYQFWILLSLGLGLAAGSRPTTTVR